MASFDIANVSSAQPDVDSKKVSFRFCRECSNMLYPKEDRENNTLMFACRTCQFSEPAGASCIYRNSLKETIAETPGNVQDVAQDPTVGAFSTQKQQAQRRKQHLFAPQTPPLEDDQVDDDDGDGYSISDMDTYEDMTMEVDGYNDFDAVADLCTLCGQQILCPTCGLPTDSGVVLEAEDPELEAKRRGEDAVQLEMRERALSGAGLSKPE